MPVDASIANDLFLSSAQRFITQSAKCLCFKKKAQCEKLVLMEALEEIYQCKRHIWLALNNINTVLSLILCMFCVWEWKCICCYFFPISSSVLILICSSEDYTLSVSSVLTEVWVPRYTVPSNNFAVNTKKSVKYI